MRYKGLTKTRYDSWDTVPWCIMTYREFWGFDHQKLLLGGTHFTLASENYLVEGDIQQELEILKDLESTMI